MNRLNRTLALVALVSLAGASPLSAQAGGMQNMGEQTNVEIEARRWSSDLGSELRLSAAGTPGESLDPIQDLGLPDEKTWDYRGQVRFGRFKVRGAWFKTKYEGEKGAERDLSYLGVVVAPGESTQSRLELEQLRVGLEVDLIQGQYAFLAVVADYGTFTARPHITSGQQSSPEEELEIRLPMLGLRARTYLTPAMAITVEATGMKRESEGVMTDFEAVATYNASPNFGFSYGYRNSYNRVKSIEAVGDRAVFRLQGQFFGVTVRF